jgi:hypothetical protein
MFLVFSFRVTAESSASLLAPEISIFRVVCHWQVSSIHWDDGRWQGSSIHWDVGLSQVSSIQWVTQVSNIQSSPQSDGKISSSNPRKLSKPQCRIHFGSNVFDDSCWVHILRDRHRRIVRFDASTGRKESKQARRTAGRRYCSQYYEQY